MENPRLHCVFFDDLLPWERHVFETLVKALGSRLNVSVHEATGDLHGNARAIREAGPGPVWAIARQWRPAARKLARRLSPEFPLHVSALDTRLTRVSLPILFWGAFAPKRTESFRVLTHSPFAYRSLSEMEGVSPSRLTLMPLPVGTSYAHRPADFPPHALKIGVLGAFHSDNGMHFALSIAHYVAQHRRDVRVRLIGRGPLEPHLRNCVNELGLAETVEIAECESAWTGLDLDLLIYSPLRTGHHIPLLIAAAAGIPALCGEVYGIEELVRDGHDGFVLPVYETKPFGELVLRMASDASLRRFFGGRLREKLLREFSIDSVADRYARHFTGQAEASAPSEAPAAKTGEAAA